MSNFWEDVTENIPNEDVKIPDGTWDTFLF